MRNPGRTRHLIFLAHIWVLSPFVFLWLYRPEIARQLSPESMAAMKLFVLGILAYVVGRTVLAIKDPRWLKWEYVFPPLDALLITVLLYIGDRDPLGNITIMYFLPIAEAAGTLNVVWAASVGLMCIAGSMVGSFGPGAEPAYNIAFRFSFLLVMSSLFTFLSRIAADYRAQLQVAKDRNRMALEMHDGVQAHLISASSQLELISHLAEGRVTQVAQESRSSLRQAADELRFLVQRMRAPAQGEGFLPALQHYAHNFCERSGLSLEFISEGSKVSLTAEQENALFRIAQEALTNVVKHARATQVVLRLSCSAQSVELEVSDDGQGIGTPTPRVGLESMRERAESEGGSVTIEERPQGGTRVCVSLPISKDPPWLR